MNHFPIKLLFYLLIVLPLSSTIAQQQSFFHLFESDNSYRASAAIETNNGEFIVAATDCSYGPGVLFRLSANGELLKRVCLNDNDLPIAILNMNNDPNNPDLFYAIGVITDYEKMTSRPYIIQFDENLNIVFRRMVELPSMYKYYDIARAFLTKTNKYIYGARLGQENGYRRLYMTISLDGTLENYTDTDVDASSQTFVNALCESPMDNLFYEYRASYIDGSPTTRMKLFEFDESFTFDCLHEFHNINQQFGDTLYLISINSSANATICPLNDSVLLFSDRASETWANNDGYIYDSDHSNILFKTDLRGNVQDYVIFGSGNDTIEYPFAFNAIDIAKNGDHSGNHFFHGCYGNNHIISLNIPYNITIAKMDENLTILWQHSYSHPIKFLLATYLISTNDGGCLIVGGAHENGHYDMFAIKTNADGIVDTNEIIVNNDRVRFYPNPTKESISIKFSPDVTPAIVELYDLQGRRILTQTKALDRIPMEGLPSGTYQVRVTMDDGSIFSDKVVKK